MFVEADPADPTRYMVWVSQSGLGMPNRDYYINKGAKFDAYRAAYLAYVTKIFELIGDANPAQSAQRVIALENKIAQVAWAEERRRSVSETNNPMDIAALKKYVPSVDWDVVLGGVGLGGGEELHRQRDHRDPRRRQTTRHRAPRRLEGVHDLPLRRLVRDRPAQGLRRSAIRVPRHGAARRGTTARPLEARHRPCIDNNIGEGLGQIYVRKHFVPETKAKMDELVANLLAATKQRLEHRPGWMTPRVPRR